jgi:PAS domain S-box-containing protein
MAQSANAPLSRLPHAIAASASLNAAPFGILWVDHEGGIGYANEHVETLLGWTSTELIGQKISQVATFWSLNEWHDTIWQKAADGSIKSVEGAWENKGEGASPMNATLTRLQVAGQGMMSIYLQPCAKTATTANAKDYVEFLDHLPTGICLVDAQLNVLQINPALCEILDSDPGSMVGKNIADLLAPAEEKANSLWHELPSIGLQGWNMKFRNSSGHKHRLVISSRVGMDEGPHRFLVIVEDISERVQLKRLLDQHEHSFEHLARNTPGMIYKFVMSPEGKASFPYASPGSYDIWEVDPEEVKDDATRIIELVHPDDLSEFQNSVMKSASELSPWEFEGRLITPSGKEKWIHAASRPELAETGDIVWQGLLMDVTHQKAIEEELKEAKKKAESAARSKADFLANMSHEIRTPMNGVIGMSELLANTELAPRQEHYVETIRSSAEVLLTIINDILDISKMEAGKLLVHMATFDMRRMLDDVATLLAPRAFDKGIELIVRYAPGVPHRVVGDAVRLRQILTNLIGNSIKFTSSGHVLVQIVETGRKDDSAMVKFSVSDTGIGISPEAMPRLFKNFEQEDSSTSRKYGGTGLGLAISRQLVELMDGKLEVESKLDKGSTFFFSLEMEVVEQDIDEEIVPIDLGRLHILSVDDHPVNRDVLNDLFDAWGLRHVEAESGEEALRLLREAAAADDPFDVGLLDFQMPGMDGVSLATAIRAEPEINDLILLMLSSASFRDDQQRELAQAGVAGQMLKPLRQFELREMLSTVLSQREGGQPADEIKVSPESNPMNEKSMPEYISPSETSTLKVLLAEDNEVNIEIAMEMLKSLGFKVDCALNGLEAVSMMKAHQYELIFMDCQMPEMDGFEATQIIRKLEGIPQPIIIAMTSHAMAGDRERCIESGMDDYLAKPVTFQQLDQIIKDHTETLEIPSSEKQKVKKDWPLFDLEAGLAVTGGSHQILKKAIAIWWRKVPDWLTELKTGFQKGDVKMIRDVAHTMRGAAATIGAVSASKTAEAIETNITGDNLSSMGHTFDSLVLDIERLRNAVREEDIPTL